MGYQRIKRDIFMMRSRMGHWDWGDIFDDLVESMAGKSFQELEEYDLVHWCQGFLADNLSAGAAGRYPPPKSTSENILHTFSIFCSVYP